MVTGGNATVFVTNMDAAIKFYTEVLGMTLASHFDDAWAEVQAGGFAIGLHPKSEKSAAPGTHGSIQIGLMVESIEDAVAKLKEHGVAGVGEIVRGTGGIFAHFGDPDGNELYFWEMPKWG
jgi:predicted enzyme related to lactoylglutathione lyase